MSQGGFSSAADDEAKLLQIAINEAEKAGFALPGCALYSAAQAKPVQESLQLSDELVADATKRAMFKFERVREVLK